MVWLILACFPDGNSNDSEALSCLAWCGRLCCLFLDVSLVLMINNFGFYFRNALLLWEMASCERGVLCAACFATPFLGNFVKKIETAVPLVNAPSGCAPGLAGGLSLFLDINLVDPASSHTLVSKIKPCMSKYKQFYTVKLRMAHYISYSLLDSTLLLG